MSKMLCAWCDSLIDSGKEAKRFALITSDRGTFHFCKYLCMLKFKNVLNTDKTLAQISTALVKLLKDYDNTF